MTNATNPTASRIRRLFLGLMVALSAPGSPALDQAEGKQFEAASMKIAPKPDSNALTTYGRVGGPGTADPGRIKFLNQSLRDLVMLAYDARFVSSGEGIDEPKFNIEAKLPDGAGSADVNSMLLALLKERLHLVAHIEQQSKSVYTLKLAKKGPQFSAKTVVSDVAPTDTPAPPSIRKAPATELDSGGFPLPRADGKGGYQSVNGKARLVLKASTMKHLCEVLSVYAGDTVVDATGLKGEYDFSLFFVVRDRDGDGPSIVEALTQQLGLEAVRSTVPQDVVVIDWFSKTLEGN